MTSEELRDKLNKETFLAEVAKKMAEGYAIINWSVREAGVSLLLQKPNEHRT